MAAKSSTENRITLKLCSITTSRRTLIDFGFRIFDFLFLIWIFGP